MHGLRRTFLASLAVVAAGVVAQVPARVAAVRANPAAQGNGPVRTIPAGQHLAAAPGQKGATFYWLEGQAARVTARYADSVVVVQRGGDGDLVATVTDVAGNEQSRLNVDGATDTLLYVPRAGTPLQAMNDSKVRPTLDWTHRQAYALWKGGTANLSWKNGIMRAAAHRDVEPSEVETVWKDGLTAKVSRKADAKSRLRETGSKTDRVVSGPALVARLSKDGVDIGGSSWHPTEQLFMWQLPATSGFVEARHLKAQFGGWPFTPDAEWVNLQTIAFQHFKSKIDAGGFVASNDRACRPAARPTLAGALADFLTPTVHANEPGCDGLHWLDGSVLRFCCDIHDACYGKSGCSASSWWTIWKSWTCDYCNMNVIMCFASGGCTCFPPFASTQPVDDPKRVPRANT